MLCTKSGGQQCLVFFNILVPAESLFYLISLIAHGKAKSNSTPVLRIAQSYFLKNLTSQPPGRQKIHQVLILLRSDGKMSSAIRQR